MKWLQKESAQYALLLVVLLATAAVAVNATLSFMDEIVPQKEHLHVITIVIWSLTTGFMLIAGAFGLWAINFAAETESIRRLSSLVDAMDYIGDGVIAMDRQGHATGMNPAAAAIFGQTARQRLLTEICPALSSSVLDTFLHSDEPFEAETELAYSGRMQTLRIRSQPSKGVVILLVSDVTDLVRSRERSRRTACVQLIGHMARGVANDFNDLLCGIAGHASLLARKNLRALDIPASASAIQDCAGRGMLLARQLMQLAESGPGESATLRTEHHVNAGTDLLKACLPGDWTIDLSIQAGVPPVNIPPVQLEHLVQSLGFVAADAAPSARSMSVTLARPDGDAESAVAAVLTVSAPAFPPAEETLIPGHPDEAGVIASVIQSLIHQSGGTMERYYSAAGTVVYRILLPEADPACLAADSPGALAMGLEAYAAGWHVLIDRDVSGGAACCEYLRGAGINVREAHGIVQCLSAIQNDERLDAIALGGGILGNEQASLLKAIARLCPLAGMVMQRRDMHDDGVPGIVYVPEPVAPIQLLHAMIEARSRARAIHRNRSIAAL